MKRRFGFLAVLLLTGLLCASTFAQSTSSIANELVEKMVAAQGGMEKVQSITTLLMKGEVNLPSMGMSMPMTLYMKKPGKVRSEVFIPNMGSTVISGYDGQTAWTLNPMAGKTAVKLTGEQLAQVRRQGEIESPLINYKEKGHSVEYLGEEEVDGKTMKKLQLVRSDSTESILYLDNETMLIVRVDAEGINPMTNQPIQTQTNITDYREVEGVQMPFRISTVMNGAVFQEITFEQISANQTISDDQFTMPEGETEGAGNW